MLEGFVLRRKGFIDESFSPSRVSVQRMMDRGVIEAVVGIRLILWSAHLQTPPVTDQIGRRSMWVARRSAVFLMSLIIIMVSMGTLACVKGPDLAVMLRESDRPVADKARDAGRNPAAVVEFLAVGEGMTVIDLLAAGGYYSEVLAEAVGPDGKVYAQNIEFLLKMRDGVNDKAMTTRLAGGRRPNIERLDREFDDLGLAPGSIDLAMTALNFHDILGSRGKPAADQVLDVLRLALVPGGVLGVIDHAGNPGEDNTALHRIEEATVIDMIEEAGFRLDASSDILRNAQDDRTQNVFTPDMRGNTDRFVLRFVKTARD